MNRMKAALKEPVTDIISPQAFIKLPFILLLRTSSGRVTLNSLNAHSALGTSVKSRAGRKAGS